MRLCERIDCLLFSEERDWCEIGSARIIAWIAMLPGNPIIS